MSQHVTNPESWIAEHLSEPQDKFARFAERVYDGDALSRKTKELIAVAVSTMLRCRHCTRSHMEKALDEGASKAAVAEALGVAWVIGSGTQVVWNKDGFEEHLHAS
ncbi:MAG: carboxymuconolactone decarboxylase family protein [Salinibacter sp.]